MTADPLAPFIEAMAAAIAKADGQAWGDARPTMYRVMAAAALDAALAVDGPVRLIVGEQVAAWYSPQRRTVASQPAKPKESAAATYVPVFREVQR